MSNLHTSNLRRVAKRSRPNRSGTAKRLKLSFFCNPASLPCQIFWNICQYLYVRDHLALSRTCCLAGKLISHPNAWETFVVDIKHRPAAIPPCEKLPLTLEVYSNSYVPHTTCTYFIRFTHLHTLELHSFFSRALHGLNECVSIRKLVLKNCLRLQSIWEVGQLPKLQTVSIKTCILLVNITPLQNCPLLEMVHMEGVPLAGIDDSNTPLTLSQLKRCPGLTHLSLTGSVLYGLEHLTHLQSLYFTHSIHDHSIPVLKHPTLQRLCFYGNFRGYKINLCASSILMPRLRILEFKYWGENITIHNLPRLVSLQKLYFVHIGDPRDEGSKYRVSIPNIEACPNVTEVHVLHSGTIGNLAPLSRMPSLRKFVIGPLQKAEKRTITRSIPNVNVEFYKC